MKKEAAQELIDSQSHELLLVAVGGVAPAEGDVAIGKRDQPAVGDSDAMGVSAEIAQYMCRPAEGPLGVDDPVISEQHTQPSGEGARLDHRQEIAVELELALMEGVAKPGDELAAEYATEHADGQEEGSPRGDPVGMIRCQTAGGNDAVDMRVKLQSLIPTVEHAEEADLGAKVSRIASDFQQRLRAGMKEQVVDEPFVL